MWKHPRMKHPDVLVEVVDEPGSLGRIGVSSPPEIMIHGNVTPPMNLSILVVEATESLVYY
ncbi:hypothetical protein GB937_009658 [Aspergillus fischeri]|nr:hypothetical protein GB937_009658 [Aspergillus fischeri]